MPRVREAFVEVAPRFSREVLGFMIGCWMETAGGQAKVAKRIGLNVSAMSRSIRGIRDFTVSEIDQIGRVLGESVDHIFECAAGFARSPEFAEIESARQAVQQVENEIRASLAELRLSIAKS